MLKIWLEEIEIQRRFREDWEVRKSTHVKGAYEVLGFVQRQLFEVLRLRAITLAGVKARHAELLAELRLQQEAHDNIMRAIAGG